MKERKKEKRYFADWIDENNPSKYEYSVILIIIILPFIISVIINYKMDMSECSYAMDSYPVDTCKYLKEIGTTTIKDGYIDTSLLPNDVLKYNISYNKYSENTIYTYSLDVNNNLRFIPTPQMTITLSNEYEILSEDSEYSSKEKYVNSIKTSIYVDTFIMGFCFGIFVVLSYLIIGFIAYQISKAHKKRDSEKDTAEKNASSDVN